MHEIVSIGSLWLPILVSAVVVFVLSSVIHMMLGYHSTDFRKLPDEAGFADAIRKLNIPAGLYMLPYAGSMKEMNSPEFQEKQLKGPGAILNVWGGGKPSMTSNLMQWFLFSVIVGIFAAYVSGRALTAGADYLAVFRFAGVTAFIGYAFGSLQESIWYKRPWSTTFKNIFDGLIYALFTGGVFGWLWPR